MLQHDTPSAAADKYFYAIFSKYIEDRANLMLKME